MPQNAIIVFGNIGNDAGYWYIGTDGKLHHVPGWNPETSRAFAELEKNFAILQKAGIRVGGVQPGNIGVKLGNTEKLG